VRYFQGRRISVAVEPDQDVKFQGSGAQAVVVICDVKCSPRDSGLFIEHSIKVNSGEVETLLNVAVFSVQWF